MFLSFIGSIRLGVNRKSLKKHSRGDVRWEVVDGFPYSGVYEGFDRVLRDFFGRLLVDSDEFVSEPTEFVELGDHVIALGHYSGHALVRFRRVGSRSARPTTPKSLNARSAGLACEGGRTCESQ